MKLAHIPSAAENVIKAIRKYRRPPMEWEIRDRDDKETTELRLIKALQNYDKCFDAVYELILACANQMSESSWPAFIEAVDGELKDLYSEDFYEKADSENQQRAADVHLSSALQSLSLTLQTPDMLKSEICPLCLRQLLTTLCCSP